MGTVHKQQSDSGATWNYATVSVKAYDEGSASAGATRRILVGQAEGEGEFIIRYFTLPPGGHSSLEHHRHQHGVVVVHGAGRVLLGASWTPIGVGDAVYIEPNELHQLQADAEGPLGFICVIPAWAKAGGSQLGETTNG